MNLIEAIKSGRRFRRACWPATALWHEPLRECTDYRFIREELLSNDWEVEENRVEITKDRLVAAFHAAGEAYVADGAKFTDRMAKELGLE